MLTPPPDRDLRPPQYEYDMHLTEARPVEDYEASAYHEMLTRGERVARAVERLLWAALGAGVTVGVLTVVEVVW
jgi:hypothetical protein